MFTGKRVRIFGHDDEAGRAAVERWARQLESVGADVDAFSFAGLRQVDGKPVKDLNDSLLMDAASFAEAREDAAMNPNHIYKPGSGATANGAGHPGDEGEEKISPFPLQHLPPAARAMAEAIARTERTPETLAGCCVLGILSASIGAGLQVTSGPNRVTRGNLYIMASAESGSGKSETFRHAARPFFAYEHDLFEHWKAETLPGLQADADVAGK